MQAVDTPDQCDRNALLAAAGEFLDKAPKTGDDGLPLARHMAAKAMDFAVFGQDFHGPLKRAVGLFQAHCAIAQ